jgi:hypothetical protein
LPRASIPTMPPLSGCRRQSARRGVHTAGKSIRGDLGMRGSGHIRRQDNSAATRSNRRSRLPITPVAAHDPPLASEPAQRKNEVCIPRREMILELPRVLIVGSGVRRISWQSKTTGSSKTSAAKTSRSVKKRLTAISPRCRGTHARSTRGISATASMINSMTKESRGPITPLRNRPRTRHTLTNAAVKRAKSGPGKEKRRIKNRADRPNSSAIRRSRRCHAVPRRRGRSCLGRGRKPRRGCS